MVNCVSHVYADINFKKMLIRQIRMFSCVVILRTFIQDSKKASTMKVAEESFPTHFQKTTKKLGKFEHVFKKKLFFKKKVSKKWTKIVTSLVFSDERLFIPIFENANKPALTPYHGAPPTNPPPPNAPPIPPPQHPTFSQPLRALGSQLTHPPRVGVTC